MGALKKERSDYHSIFNYLLDLPNSFITRRTRGYRSLCYSFGNGAVQFTKGFWYGSVQHVHTVTDVLQDIVDKANSLLRDGLGGITPYVLAGARCLICAANKMNDYCGMRIWWNSIYVPVLWIKIVGLDFFQVHMFNGLTLLLKDSANSLVLVGISECVNYFDLFRMLCRMLVIMKKFTKKKAKGAIKEFKGLLKKKENRKADRCMGLSGLQTEVHISSIKKWYELLGKFVQIGESEEAVLGRNLSSRNMGNPSVDFIEANSYHEIVRGEFEKARSVTVVRDLQDRS